MTILFFPGFLGHRRTFERISALLGERNCHTVLLTGHGDPGATFISSYTQEVRRIAALVATFPAPRVLVGYSMGGRLTLSLVSNHSDLAERLVLLSARGGLATLGERSARRAADEIWAHRLSTWPLSSVLDAWDAQPLFASRRRLASTLRARERRYRLTHNPFALAGALRALGLAQMPSQPEQLGRLAIPVQVLAGELDQKFVTLGRSLAAQLPQGRFSVVDGAGHDLVLEAPEAVARTIVEGFRT